MGRRAVASCNMPSRDGVRRFQYFAVWRFGLREKSIWSAMRSRSSEEILIVALGETDIAGIVNASIVERISVRGGRTKFRPI